MTNFLSDESTYRLLEKDPTPSLQRKMNATLLQLKKDRKIPTTKYNTLRCSSGRIPSIYGLPKIHKPDIPLRPIVSFYSSPTYELSKFLVICLFEVQIVSHAPWMEACHHVSHQRIVSLFLPTRRASCTPESYVPMPAGFPCWLWDQKKGTRTTTKMGRCLTRRWPRCSRRQVRLILMAINQQKIQRSQSPRHQMSRLHRVTTALAAKNNFPLWRLHILLTPL